MTAMAWPQIAQNFLIPWLLIAAVMTAAWLVQRRSGNAGVVDFLWSASIGCLAAYFALTGAGDSRRRYLVLALVGWWSARLSWLLWRRLRTEAEDGRYSALRKELGERFQGWLFVFYQGQGLLAVLLSLVFWSLCQIPSELGTWDYAAASLWIVAQVGEAVSDAQLHEWRSNPANRGHSCRAGLWNYSRHPNYFFEWLHWVAYGLMALGSELWWPAWAAAGLMLLLVLKVTGIPPTEARALESRGEDYRAYQRTTSAFFPWFSRQDPLRITDTQT